MYRDLLGAFTGLFTQRRNRLEVAGLLVVMAMLPVSELLVTRLFSHLVIDGAERLETERTAVVLAAAGFFAAFAASRAIHHVVRLNRVRVFRRGFESSQAHRPRQQEAWSWAAAFELSTASVALIQVLAFCLLFVWLDPVFGVLNAAIGAGVLGLLAVVYRRQLTHQLSYLAERRGSTTAVGERVGRRLRDAELGAVLASLAMALALGLVLLRAVTGAMAAADAIVLFIGLRMMYGQVGHLSASAMRFARVEARLRGGSSTDLDLDAEDDEGDGDGEGGPRAALDLPPDPSPHRATLVRQMVAAGQQGDLTAVRSYAARLRTGGGPSPAEADAHRAAEAFAALRAPVVGVDDGAPLPLTWWPRPLPGTAANWALPLAARRLAGRSVAYVKPGSSGGREHLLLGTSLLAAAGPRTVVVGAGTLTADDSPDPRATVLSVRGPLSAAALHRAGRADVAAWGDPLVLLPRAVPIVRPVPNGRLAVVRHASQAHLPLVLPDDADELSPLASRPDDVVALLTALAAYDGVVTSDPGVAALCHGYGLPCAGVAPEHRADLDHVLRDHALGVGLDDVVSVPTGPDLRRTDLRALLHPHLVADRVVDDVARSFEDALAHLVERAPA